MTEEEADALDDFSASYLFSIATATNKTPTQGGEAVTVGYVTLFPFTTYS